MSARAAGALAGASVLLAATMLACGDVPTLGGGVAYISPVILPALAVAAGDQLRDSAGNVAPLRIIAYDRSDAELPGVAAVFVPTSLPAPITIAEDGVVTASDTVSTVQTVQLVGRVGDRLQTTPASLLIVSQPDSMANASPAASTRNLPALDTMRVVVTGVNRAGSRVAVPGIIVSFRIGGVYANEPDGATAILTLDGRTVSRPDPAFSVDTTDTAGQVSRTLVVAGTGVDSVVVFARALSLRGTPLHGDSLRFILLVPPPAP